MNILELVSFVELSIEVGDVNPNSSLKSEKKIKSLLVTSNSQLNLNTYYLIALSL